MKHKAKSTGRTSSAYQPERGDFVYLDFSPQAGREQAGRRPALVLSSKDYNIATGLAYVCPVTSQVKGSPFEVAVPRGAKLKGVILTDNMRSLDWIVRNAEFHSAADEHTLCEVVARIEAILGIEL